MRPPHSGGIRKLEDRKARIHRRDRRKNWEVEKRSSSKVR